MLILPWKHLYQANNRLPFTIQTLISPLEHSTQKSKHANDKLFSYLQEAYLWVKARDFCIHQLQRLQVRGGPLLWLICTQKITWISYTQWGRSSRLGNASHPTNGYSFFITCSTVSGEKTWGRPCDVSDHQRGEANWSTIVSGSAFGFVVAYEFANCNFWPVFSKQIIKTELNTIAWRKLSENDHRRCPYMYCCNRG